MADPGEIVRLEPLPFPERPRTQRERAAREGRFEVGAPDWVYLPLEVPDGVRDIAVRYSYDKPVPPAGAPENALDIGIFDERGLSVADGAGFRGWSGGFRDAFTISASDATPGYLPGPIRPGTWHVVLGPYTVAPPGMSWRVEVEVGYGEPDAPFVPTPAPRRAAGRGAAWYRGDLHMHTVHSDGQREPDQLADQAREAGLDFIVSTEHNTCSASGIWGRHAGDDLLIIDGEEVTTRNGHFIAAGLPPGAWIDWRYRNIDGVLPGVARRIHARGGLVIAAHPFCPMLGCGWKFGYEGFDAVEVWNGFWTPDDEVALLQWDAMLAGAARSDRWLPAVGSSDTHREDQPVGHPQTIVLANDLSRDEILAGLRAGRAYIAESASVELDFTAMAAGRRAGIGERLDASRDDDVTITLTVRGAPGANVQLHTDAGKAVELPLAETEETTVTWHTRPRIAAYVRAEVRRKLPLPIPGVPLTMVAITNPIFLGP